jgi:hypothetical protein
MPEAGGVPRPLECIWTEEFIMIVGNTPHVEGSLLVFTLPAGTPLDVHRRFRKRIYGEETSSWAGRYRYRRKGLLDEIPHVKLYTGVIIVRKEDAKRVIAAVRENGGECIRRDLRLTREDLRVLYMAPRRVISGKMAPNR